jgi:hypothetical protein
MAAGECVLQPPGIRHRVLECSPGLEVIELATPAVHATFADHELTLPTPPRERSYEGQQFAWLRRGFADDAMTKATGGLASLRVRRDVASSSRRGDVASSSRRGHDASSGHVAPITQAFGFVLAGSLVRDGQPLVATDAFVGGSLADGSPDLEWLEVTL